MMYERAADAFAAASREQPGCALAYWGEAMSFVHPIWSDPPNADTFAQGVALVDTARRQKATPRERAYIEALRAYYAAGKSNKEAANLLAFSRAWSELHDRYPEDPEAALFHALSQLATADPSDKTFAQQRRAGELIEQVFKRHPDHPGAHHYIIHAYDYPPLAQRALAVARDYGKIAPEVPHALDYLVYAHLQRGQDAKAAEVARKLSELDEPAQAELASAYAFAAIPARMVLERQRWAEAAALEPRVPSSYPWDSVPAVEAISQFARALGAARSGRIEQSRDALARLAVLRDKAGASNAYWETQVEIQRLTAFAWLSLAEGQREKAFETMRAAAALEATTEKHPVTPGEVLPARELFADMLLELGQPAAAQAEYAATLKRSPRRVNSLYGAARAAELAGTKDTAVAFYRELVELLAGTDSEVEGERLRHAESFIATH